MSTKLLSSIVTLIVISLAAKLHAGDLQRDITVATQINAANELVRSGKVDDAIEQYGLIDASPEYRDELTYNEAVAAYRAGDLVQAADKFKSAAGVADTEIAASSRFNLGNCDYAAALQLTETDKAAAIERLRSAIDHYRGSLRSNPNLADARANIELAGQLIKQLEEQQQQQEQQDQSHQRDSEDQDKQDQQQSEEQNESEQQQSQENQDSQSDQDSQSSDSDKQESSEDDSKQDASEDPNQAQSGESDNQKVPEQRQGNEGESPQDQSNRASQQSEKVNSDEPSASDEEQDEVQSVPTGDLEAAGEENDREPREKIGVVEPNATGKMNREEAMKMLQAVRDRDMLRRLQREQRERSRHVPVDRDW